MKTLISIITLSLGLLCFAESKTIGELHDGDTVITAESDPTVPEAVKEIVGPMIGDATNDLGKAKRDKTDLDVYQIGVVPEGPWTWTSSDERLAAALTRDGVVPTFGRFYGEDDVWAPVPDAGDDWSGDGPVFYVPSDEESVSMYFTRSWAPGEPAIVATATRHPVEKSVGKLSHVKESGGALPTGLAKLGAGGELAAATPSSTGGAEADYRDPQDNTCHKTELSDTDFTPSSEIPSWWTTWSLEFDGYENWSLTINGHARAAYGGNLSTKVLPFIDGDTSYGPYPQNFTRKSFCTSGEKFVTDDVVDGKVSAAVSTNNPAFVSAVRNTLTENMPEDMPTDWGTYGTVGAALAALAAFVKWAKAKIVAVVGDDGKPTDTFATDLLGKSVAIQKIDERLPIPISAKNAGFTTESYKRFVVTVGDDMTLTLHTPTAKQGGGYDADVFECRFDGTSLTADKSISFATSGATATTMDTDCGTVKAGKVALMSAFWNGATWDVNWKVEG